MAGEGGRDAGHSAGGAPPEEAKVKIALEKTVELLRLLRKMDVCPWRLEITVNCVYGTPEK